MSIKVVSRRLERADWWGDMSEKQQDVYLKNHPQSKKAKELRQQKQGHQPKHSEDSPKEQRMFGEHEEEHLKPPGTPPKEELVDSNPGNKELKIPEIKPSEEAPKEEPESKTPEQDTEAPKEAAPKEEPKNAEPEANPDDFVDEYSTQIEKGPSSKVAKEFFKKAKTAQGPEAEHYAQMEDIWNRTSSFEELGLEPTEFTKDSLIFRGKPEDHHGLLRDLNRLGKGNLKADDHGNLSGDLEINGKKVTVLMHRMGRGGETLVSIYPLLDKPKPNKEGEAKKSGSPLLQKMAHALKHLAPVDKEFFEKEEYKPRSKSRRTFAKFFKDKTKGILKHLHHQSKEWHTALKAVKKMVHGTNLNEHDKEALHTVAKDIVYTLISVSIAGGLGHGIIGLLHHVGIDIVRDSLIKAAAHSAIHASMIRGAKEQDDDAFLEEVMKHVSDAIENQDIPDEVWEKVLQSAAPQAGEEDVPDEKAHLRAHALYLRNIRFGDAA